MRSLPLSKQTLSPTQLLGHKDLGLPTARVSRREEGGREVRKALESRLSQTGWDRGERQTRRPLTPFLVGWPLFPEAKQHSGRLNWGVPPTPRRTRALRTGCWPATGKAKKEKKMFESHSAFLKIEA